MTCFNCGQPGLVPVSTEHRSVAFSCPRCSASYHFELVREDLPFHAPFGVVLAQARISEKESHPYEHS